MPNPDTDSARSSSTISSPVPVEDIRFARKTFGTWKLSFEILLETNGTSQGLDLCADLDRVGLQLKHVSFANNGCLQVRLADEGSVDPTVIEAVFDEHPGVSILKWTNHVANASAP
ncbi:hypothetical protein R3X27_13830 [Tropicimonas sp. TH_r6]|uniref:hypothetical protein n=1 Tax=Tropicimonas sp. TH_r6 TaxID=3082085 RepID=UPI00295369EC|nr:hypothetical protein [Tropicimonas sp. TH_r6]MDV7143762.1 hypothetical protein [Tropicimonas sp. TH_r6]